MRSARNAALLLTTEIVGKASTFVFTVVAARTLSQAEFGAFAYALAFSVLVAAVPTWGFNRLVAREGSQSPERLDQLYVEALAWRTALVVPMFVLAGVVGVATRPSTQAAQALVLVLAAAACDVYSTTAKAVAAVRGELRGWALGLIINRVVSTALGVAFVIAGFGVVGLSAGYLIGSASGAALALASVARLGVRPRLALLTRSGWVSMGLASVALGTDALLSMALSKVDTIILAGLQGDEAVAVYAVAYRLLETVLFVTWALDTVVFPRMSVASGAEVRRLTERTLGAVASLFVPFGVLLAVRGQEVLGLVFGAPYERGAAGTVQWLAAAPLLFAIGFSSSSALLSRRRNGLVVGATLLAVVSNVGLNLAFIPRFGPAGAAAATTGAYALEAAVLMVFLANAVGWLRLDRVIAVPGVAAAGLAAALLLVPGGLLPQVAVGGVIYGGGWWLLARRLSPEVIDLMAAAARRRSPRAHSVSGPAPPDPVP